MKALGPLLQTVLPRVSFAVAAAEILLSGCSALGRITVVHADPDPKEWVARPLNSERPHRAGMRYEFARSGVTVSTCTMQLRLSILGMGPPLLPIIPIGFLPYTSFGPDTEYNVDHLFAYLQIDSPGHSTNVDLSQVRLRVDGAESPLAPEKVRRYKPDKDWPLVCQRHLSNYDTSEAAASQVIAKAGAQYVFFFDYPWKDIEAFSIDFGSLGVGGESIRIPPLSYRRHAYYGYIPLIIPPGGHGDPLPVLGF